MHILSLIKSFHVRSQFSYKKQERNLEKYMENYVINMRPLGLSYSFSQECELRLLQGMLCLVLVTS